MRSATHHTPTKFLSDSTAKPKPKQEELNKKIAVEKYLLLCLHKKKEHGVLSKSDESELKSRTDHLKTLEKELHKLEDGRLRAKKHRDIRKRKMKELDEETRKKLTGKGDISRGAPSKVDDDALIEAITHIAIQGSAAHERRRQDDIRNVKTID